MSPFLDSIIAFSTLPAGTILWRLIFWYFLWLPIAFAFLWGAKEIWLYYRQGLFLDKVKYTLLAIDVPRNNEQAASAVENIFSYLSGAQKDPNLTEKWWDGYVQVGFSMEIIGIDGYIQYLLHTPDSYRDLAESAIYSEYPDAEITPIEDYAKSAPTKYPDEEWDLWGSEIVPVKDASYPIKTYIDFYDLHTKPEVSFKDPLGHFLDLLNSLKPGEQFWYQLRITPTSPKDPWTLGCDAAINKIFKIKPKPKATAITMFGDFVMSLLPAMFKSPAAAPTKEEVSLKMMDLGPIAKKQVEAISRKKSKIGFMVKFRVIYITKKELLNKGKGVSGFFGYVKNYADNDLNAFKPDSKYTATTTNYFFKDKRSNARKGKIVRNYRTRSGWMGGKSYVLNTEELATLWHFPNDLVTKAPLLQRAAARRIEPPMALPLSEEQVIMQQGEDIFSSDYQLAGEPEVDLLGQETARLHQAAESKVETPNKHERPGFMDDESKPTVKPKDEPPANLPFA